VQRIQPEYAGVIHAGLRLIEAEGISFGTVDFLTGVDPLYAGLHSFRETGDGRLYSQIGHFVWEAWSPDKRGTVVLPVPPKRGLHTVVHELGHALDERLGFSFDADPTCDYAQTSRAEAFACAFEDFITEPRSLERYQRTVAFFEGLRGLTIDGRR